MTGNLNVIKIVDLENSSLRVLKYEENRSLFRSNTEHALFQDMMNGLSRAAVKQFILIRTYKLQ